MEEKEIVHATDSILYAMEQTVTYFRVKGAQVFNNLNFGITSDQFFALDALYVNDGVCQRDLSKIILKDRSNTGRILGILEEKEFITRNVEMKGKRVVKKIYITEKGKKMVEECLPKLKSTFCSVLDSVSEEELKTLRVTLNKLRECLSKITTIQI